MQTGGSWHESGEHLETTIHVVAEADHFIYRMPQKMTETMSLRNDMRRILATRFGRILWHPAWKSIVD